MMEVGQVAMLWDLFDKSGSERSPSVLAVAVLRGHQNGNYRLPYCAVLLPSHHLHQQIPDQLFSISDMRSLGKELFLHPLALISSL